MQQLQSEKIKNSLPKMSTLRRRLALLNTGAEPGPSGMRNSTLMRVRRNRNGAQALQKWVAMWCSGNVVPYT
eukprot:8701184-Karenia_brevis.AAC.1